MSNPEKKQRVSVDVSRYNIQLPENGIMVSFETLPASNYKDSIWYDKKPQGNPPRWIRKMPGIDMDLKKKDDYNSVYNKKDDLKGPYTIVINTDDKWSLEEVKFHSYVFPDVSLAITLTIKPAQE